MPKLKKEMFARHVRFQHRFGDTDDPFMSGAYFDAPYPDGIKSVNMNGKGAFSGKQHGLQVLTEPMSGVDKFKGGKASLSGPKPDVPDEIGERIPVSTARRKVTAGAK